MYAYVLSLCLAAPGQAPDALAAPTPLPAGAVTVAAVPPISHYDFACMFQPAPGKYEVVFLHPRTCCPVKVCFELPCACCPPKVCAGKRTLRFDYGKRSVVIAFSIFGSRARVRYL